MKNKFKVFVGVMIILGLLSCSKKHVDKSSTTSKPDLDEPEKAIEIGPMFTTYKLDYAYDHSFIYHPGQKKWHMYGIPKDHSYFIHLTADNLTDEGWTLAEPFRDKGQSIWAPHIINHEGTYYMFYTSIGTPREIKLATTKDFITWQRTDEPLFAWKSDVCPNMKNKDPMVFWDEEKEQWVIYVSMLKDATHWVVGYATSTDLRNWSEPEICFDENTTMPSVESPFVVKRGEWYYMLLSARPWPYGAEEIFKSKTPYHWEVTDLVASFKPWHAAEVIQDLDGKWYLSHCSGEKGKDYRMSELFWNDGLEN